MNPLVQHNITDEDVITEYRKYNDVKKVTRIFDLSVQDVRDVLKSVK